MEIPRSCTKNGGNIVDFQGVIGNLGVQAKKRFPSSTWGIQFLSEKPNRPSFYVILSTFAKHYNSIKI